MGKAKFGSVSGRTDAWAALGLFLGIAFFLVSGAVAYLNIQGLGESDRAIRHTHNVLIALDELREQLRQDGAVGSGGGVFFGFGVHLNVQIASDRAESIVPPLLAYALIEDWLRTANPIDHTRRVLPFAAPYPRRLVRRLIALPGEHRAAPILEIDAEVIAVPLEQLLLVPGPEKDPADALRAFHGRETNSSNSARTRGGVDF